MGRNAQTGADPNFLISALASRDGMVRRTARASLVAMGKPAVALLIRALGNSKVDQVRWEAAKALGTMGEVTAIPALVGALDDRDPDVAWLAAEALQRFKKAAWPALLHALIQRGAHSASLRQGAHHVLRDQREKGFNDLLARLRKALEAGTIPEMAAVAAYEMLQRMNARAPGANTAPE